jgi:hypothetical protein
MAPNHSQIEPVGGLGENVRAGAGTVVEHEQDARLLAQAQARLEQRRTNAETGAAPSPLPSAPSRVRRRPQSDRGPYPAIVDTTHDTPPRVQPELDTTSYYDFDFAEFPWCLLSKSQRPSAEEPLVHRSYYTNQNTGDRVERVFETFPAPPPKGLEGPQFPGPTGHALFYAALQLYVEQGATDDKVVFGSRRHLCRRLGINQSGENIQRVGRELEILCGIRVRAENAYWDPKKRAYVHMKMWSPFTGAFYFTASPGFENQEELPFGYLQVHPQLQRIARTRGFFALGFPPSLFYKLTALEQRLAIFLARRFHFHKLIRLDAEEVAHAMPITAKAAKHRRANLKRAAQGLLDKGFPLLREFRIRSSKGIYLAEFSRKARPKPEKAIGAFTVDVDLSQHEREVVSKIVAATDDPGAFYWYAHCVKTLGPDVGLRALGGFRELYIDGDQPIRTSKGQAMTGVLKGIAKEMNLVLTRQ